METAFMQRCDTISFDIPTSEILYREDNFQQLNLRNGEIMASHYSKKLYPGINGIVIGHGGNTNIKVSAKILGNDYVEGITKNNIEHVFDVIRKQCGVSFNTDTALQSKVRRVDINKNVRVDGVVKDYLEAYNLLTPNPTKIRKDTYKRSGFVWDRKTKTYSERFIMYDKQRDLMRSTNQEFMGLHDGNIIMKSFENVLRVEQNNQKGGALRTIRNRFAVDDSRLDLVLESPVNVVWKVYERMMDNSNRLQYDIFIEDYLERFDTWRECRDYIGYKGVFEMCGSLPDTLLFIKRFYADKSNPSREMVKVRKAYYEFEKIKNQEIRDSWQRFHERNSNSLINEVEYKMKYA
jgi:hypothetical protein